MTDTTPNDDQDRAFEDGYQAGRNWPSSAETTAPVTETEDDDQAIERGRNAARNYTNTY